MHEKPIHPSGELSLPSSEGQIIPSQVAQQQLQGIYAYIETVTQFNLGIQQLDQKIAEHKQVVEGEFNAVQRNINTSLEQAQHIREKASKRWKELLGDRPLVTANADLTSEQIANQQTGADNCRAAQAQLTELERYSKLSSKGINTFLLSIFYLGYIIGAIFFEFDPGLLLSRSVPLIIIMVIIYLFTSILNYHNIKSIAHTLMQHLANVEQWSTHQADAASTRYQQQLADIEHYEQQKQQARDTLGRQMGTWTTATMDFVQRTSHISPGWDDVGWNDWNEQKLVSTPAPILRIGSFNPSLFDGRFLLPIYSDFPGNRALLFKVTGAIKAPAITAVQSLILRLLATIPPGQVRFTFIDPVGLGQHVAAFMRLADDNEALVSGKAWSEPRQIEQQLTNLTDHMGNVIQKYLRNQYQTIAEYNAQAAVPEPYQVLVVFDFPVNFQDEAARRLVSIAQNGARCGVFTIIVADLEKPRPYGFDLADLERTAAVISWHNQNQGFVLADAQYEHLALELDTMPDPSLVNRILETVGKASIEATRVEVPFDNIAPPPTDRWTQTTRDLLHVAMGPSAGRKPQYFTLGSGTAHHALVVGQTGSGKSTLLHILITGIALTYSPAEMELYLLDFKKGIEFKIYAEHQLPHARVIAIESEREFGLSVLEGLYREYERRGDRFRELGVNSLNAYRQQTGQVMSRVLLLVDEFHKFFIEQDSLSHRAYQLLELLVREGRSMGIHVVLASQTLTGAASLPDSIKSSIGVRIALRCSEADSRLILADDNTAARLLSRPGEAIYNDKNGLEEGNNRFQVAWLSDEDHDQYLQQIRQHARPEWYAQPPIVFEGNQPADIHKNVALKAALEASGPARHPRSLTAWLGEPIAIKESVAATFSRQSGTNMLIVGTDSQAALGIITTMIVSLAAQLPRGAVQGAQTFSVLDFSADDSDDYFRDLADTFPGPMAVGRRRQMPGMINVIAQEVQRRLDADETGARPIFFMLYGLHRARDLRLDAPSAGALPGMAGSIGAGLEALDTLPATNGDELGLSNAFGSMFSGTNHAAPTMPANPVQQLGLILREGPEVGVHTIIWCDTMTNLNRSLDRYTLREFVLRVAFQMSESDSHNLVESAAANKLGQHRALLYNDEAGTVEKFRPYAVPNAAWRTWAFQCLSSGVQVSG